MTTVFSAYHHQRLLLQLIEDGIPSTPGAQWQWRRDIIDHSILMLACGREEELNPLGFGLEIQNPNAHHRRIRILHPELAESLDSVFSFQGQDGCERAANWCQEALRVRAHYEQSYSAVVIEELLDEFRSPPVAHDWRDRAITVGINALYFKATGQFPPSDEELTREQRLAGVRKHYGFLVTEIERALNPETEDFYADHLLAQWLHDVLGVLEPNMTAYSAGRVLGDARVETHRAKPPVS